MSCLLFPIYSNEFREGVNGKIMRTPESEKRGGDGNEVALGITTDTKKWKIPRATMVKTGNYHMAF